MSIEKPPYAIPSMAEIRKIRWNGYSLVSTFSGAGGSCLGFRWAGFKTVYASEFVEAARETYAANHGLVPDPRDIRKVTGESIRRLARKQGLAPRAEIDVLEGSPPCSSFSMAGVREKHWGMVTQYSDVEQRTDDLFGEFARLLHELRPRVFVAENVAGLLRGVSRGYFKEIHASLAAAGYVVRARLLDAQWLGVPQQRQRVIFIGAREDLGVEPIFPTPLPYRYSIRDALPHLGRVTGRTGQHFKRVVSEIEHPMNTLTAHPEQNRYEVREGVRANGKRRALDRPAPTIQTHGNAFTHSELVVVRKTGGHNFKDVERSIDEPISTIMAGSPARGRTDSFEIRASPRARPAPLDEPSPTILAVNSGWSDVAPGKMGPKERRKADIRKFEIREIARLCGFPDDFVVTGTYSQQWERFGRAVPPPMSYRIALGVRRMLDEASKKEKRR